MTVQELIDRLTEIEDKSRQIAVGFTYEITVDDETYESVHIKGV